MRFRRVVSDFKHQRWLKGAEDSQKQSTPDYALGYSRSVNQLMSRRKVATHAGYLLRHLKAGMRVLDVVCGPGIISLGLAEAIVPGELYGIDMEQSQVDLAIEAARQGGHDNAHF